MDKGTVRYIIYHLVTTGQNVYICIAAMFTFPPYIPSSPQLFQVPYSKVPFYICCNSQCTGLAKQTASHNFTGDIHFIPLMVLSTLIFLWLRVLLLLSGFSLSSVALSVLASVRMSLKRGVIWCCTVSRFSGW